MEHQVYLSKVSNSATADGSTPFFKIYEDTWGRNTAGGGGSDDYWGTKDLNTHCGKLDVKIPAGLAPGDYLLRAEAIALHAAGSSGGAQVRTTDPPAILWHVPKTDFEDSSTSHATS